MEQANVIERAATLAPVRRPVTADEKQRTVEAIVLGQREIQRWDPLTQEHYLERLELDGADLSRLNSGAAPVLDSHARASVRNQVGVVEKAWIEDGKLHARLRFSARPEVEPIWQDVQDGVIRAVSLGATIEEKAWQEAKDGEPRVLRISRWTPFEVSLVPVGADAEATTRNLGGGNTMATEAKERKSAAVSAGNPAREEILKRAQPLIENGQLSAGFVQDLIEAGYGVNEASEKIFERLAATNRTDAPPRVEVGRDLAREDIVERMGEALYCRVNPAAKPSDGARPFVGRRIADLAREFITRPLPGATDAQVIERALSTSDFPYVLANAAGKMLRASYEAAPSGVRQVARRTEANDFKTRYSIRMGEMPTLVEVPENAEYTYGSRGESQETYALKTYGRIFGISRQILVNDDLGAFNDLAREYGQAAAAFEAQFLVDLLTSNSGVGPTMSDGNPLFDASNHGNYTSSGTAISVDSLGLARKLMRLQTGVDGTTLINAEPRFLLVPASLETTAEKVMAEISAASVDNVNPFAGKLQPVVDPRLDAKSSTRWYLFANPAVLPVLEYAYLAGQPGLYIETRVGFNIDGLEVKARLDFGAGVIDYRGAYANAGA